MKALALAAALAALAPAAEAGMRTVTFDAPMSCPMSDPPVYELTARRIAGVTEAIASYDDGTLVVTFDDTLATVKDFIAAFDALGATVTQRAPDN